MGMYPTLGWCREAGHGQWPKNQLYANGVVELEHHLYRVLRYHYFFQIDICNWAVQNRGIRYHSYIDNKGSDVKVLRMNKKKTSYFLPWADRRLAPGVSIRHPEVKYGFAPMGF